MIELSRPTAVPAPRPAIADAPVRAKPTRLLATILPHVPLVAMTLLFLLPIVWMLSSALKTNEQIFGPLQWWPNPAHWENFVAVWNREGFPYLRMLGNTVFYAGLATLGTVLSCAIVAYGFARLRFPGRDALFSVTIATLMIPPIVLFIPTYVLFKELHLLGTYAPLIAPKFFGDAFYIFMLRQFFLGLPHDLSDAARLDGANEFRIFWEIMLPLVKPALMVVVVFKLLVSWHDFFGPLIYLADQESYPLSLGLFAFQSERTKEWGLLMAAATLVTLPLIVLFAFTQRYFVGGIKLSGIKG